MEVQGLVHLIGETETVGNNGFTKRLIVVKTEEQYPQLIGIDFVKDKTSILDNYKVGQDVKVSINLGGREWINPQGEAKYFNSITGWRIESVQDAPNVPLPPVQEIEDDNEPDDLPF